MKAKKAKAAEKSKPAKKKAVKKRAAAKKAPRKLAKVSARKTAAKKPARKVAVNKQAPRAIIRAVVETAPQKFTGAVAPLMNVILSTLDDAKAENTVALNIAGRSSMADAMVVTTGRVDRHVAAIADQLITKLKHHGVKNMRVEGQDGGDWCLVDAGDVIIHIFRPEVRAFYNLEKLWSADAPREQA